MDSNAAVRRAVPGLLFSPRELARFRALLSEQLACILESCQGLSQDAFGGRRSRAGLNASGPPHDESAAERERDLSFYIGRAEAELRDIAQALVRMDEKRYGRCEGCDQPIPLSRLEATPAARTCIGCRPRAGDF